MIPAQPCLSFQAWGQLGSSTHQLRWKKPCTCLPICAGGQKARLALARAAYSQAAIQLLDDPLSAVDPRVGRVLFNQCIGPQGIMAGGCAGRVGEPSPALHKLPIVSWTAAGIKFPLFGFLKLGVSSGIGPAVSWVGGHPASDSQAGQS